MEEVSKVLKLTGLNIEDCLPIRKHEKQGSHPNFIFRARLKSKR